MLNISAKLIGAQSTEVPTTPTSWLALQIFNTYRLVLVTVLFSLYTFKYQTLDDSLSLVPSNLATLLISYFIVTILFFIFAAIKKPNFLLQVRIQVYIDVIVLTCFMHAGLTDRLVLGILINAAIAGGSVLTAGRVSIFFAIVAGLAIISENVITQYELQFNVAKYVDVALLGITFFATAILAFGLSKKLRLSEEVARQKSLEVTALQHISQQIIQKLNSGVIVLNERGEIDFMNNRASYLMGCQGEIKGCLLKTISVSLANYLRQWNIDKAKRQEPLLLSGSDTRVNVEFIQLQDHHLNKQLVFLQDIALAAQQAQEIKLVSLGRLTASIAHEIRNPLSAIKQAAQLLAESVTIVKSEQRLIEIIDANTNRVNSIVRNILDISRRDKTHLVRFQLKEFINDFIKDLIDTKQLKADAITVVVNNDKLEVTFDRMQLEQVLMNLCENSLRYVNVTKPGPLISLRFGIDPESSYCYLDVIDNGNGVEADKIINLFEPFYTTEVTGTGLGLYICREICEANLARIFYVDDADVNGYFRILFYS